MSRCYNCDIEVRGEVDICPLCHNKLERGDDTSGVFPIKKIGVPLKKISFDKIFWFVFFNTVFVCLFINIFLQTYYWSIVVAAVLLYVYVLIKNTILSKTDISKKLFFQTIVLSLIFVAMRFVFDGPQMTWVFEYVLPIIYAVSALIYGILIFIRVHNFHDYIIYELFVLLLGVIPTVLYLGNVIEEGIPSFICFFVCILVFLSNIIFSWKFLVTELKKRFHA